MMDYRTREQWGAEFDVSPIPMIPVPVRYLFTHHTAGTYTDDPNDDMLTIERIDINRFGKPSYDWGIHPSGVVLEGMGRHLSPDTFGHNRDSLSIMFMGNFEYDEPTEAAMLAGRELVQTLLRVGWITHNTPMLGHKDVYATACPGANLYPRIQELLVPPLPTPPTPPTPVPPPGDDMPQKARYMRPHDDAGVALVFDTGAIVPVSNFANTEEVFVKQMGVVIDPYPVHEIVTDAAGDQRKVWVTNDAGMSKAIKRATT